MFLARCNPRLDAIIGSGKGNAIIKANFTKQPMLCITYWFTDKPMSMIRQLSILEEA